MRIAVLFQDRCKPNSPAFEYLQKYAGSCGGNVFRLMMINAEFSNLHALHA